HSFIIQTRFDGNHIAGAQNVFAAVPERRRFMNVETEPVSRSMKESLHSSIHQTRSKTFSCKVVQDLVMNIVGVCTVGDSAEADLLPIQYAMIGVFQSFGGAPANYRTRDIAEIPCILRAREDVHDDRRIRANWAASLIVRVDALIARCSDRVAR